MGFKLVEKKSELKNIFILTIIADSNDGDYISESMSYTKTEFEKLIPELINLINNYSESHELEKYPNTMDLSIPFNGYSGYCHTLEELNIEFIDENGKIFDVDIF